MSPQEEDNSDDNSVDDDNAKSDTTHNSNDTIGGDDTTTNQEDIHRRNDRLMAKQFRKSAIETIDEKRELFIEYKKEQKGRMISFLTCILTDPLTPIFNQFFNEYLTPINFSIFEGIQAEQVKKLIVSQEQIEMLQHAFQKGDEEKNIFQIQTKPKME